MRRDDDQCRAVVSQFPGFGRDRLGQRCNFKPNHVCGNGRHQGLARNDADDAHLDTGRIDHDRRIHVVPRHRLTRGGVDQVGREQRESRLAGALPEVAARVLAGLYRDGIATFRAEIEFMVADRRGCHTHGIVGVDDDGPFNEVGFERPLPHIARIDEQHGTAIVGTRLAQGVDVGGHRDQSTCMAVGGKRAVHIVGADNRNRDFIGRRRGGDAGRKRQRQEGGKQDTDGGHLQAFSVGRRQFYMVPKLARNRTN